MNWMDSVLKSVSKAGKAVAKAAPKQAPARSRPSGSALRSFDRPAPQKRDAGWSKLLLEITDTVKTPDGLHYTVKPAEQPKKEKKVDERSKDLRGGKRADENSDLAQFVPKEFDGREKEKSREEASDAARVERSKVLGIGADNTAASFTPEVEELTAAEYSKLTPRQKAAVDYNTILTDAVAKDLANQDEYKRVKGQARKTYDIASEELFGKDRGSDLYAPETLAVLRQLNLKDSVADLDDYLGLKVAVTEDDLGALATEANRGRANIMNPGDMGRADLVNNIADKTENLQQALAAGNKMLQNFNASSLAERATDVGHLGGTPEQVEPQLGFGTGEVDQYFQGAFDVLGNAANDKDRDQILSVMKSELQPDELDAFFQYADVRSKTAAQYNLPLGGTEGVKYRTPDEFRKILGLGE